MSQLNIMHLQKNFDAWHVEMPLVTPLPARWVATPSLSSKARATAMQPCRPSWHEYDSVVRR